jgi:hypothetical protein
MAAIGREGGESRGAKNRRRQTVGRGADVGGSAYSDRESPVEVSREGMVSSVGSSQRISRDEMDEGVESVRDEDATNPT